VCTLTHTERERKRERERERERQRERERDRERERERERDTYHTAGPLVSLAAAKVCIQLYRRLSKMLKSQ
jgi:septal ring factor EnvC (AmiA/AmiB activator)